MKRYHDIRAWHALHEKLRVSLGPYFPVWGMNAGKDGPEKTPYLDTFHAVLSSLDFLKLSDIQFKLK